MRLPLTAILLLAACADATRETPPFVPAELTVVSGADQALLVGVDSSAPIVIRVRGRDGSTRGNVPVEWAIPAHEGRVLVADTVTANDGTATARVVLHGLPGATAIRVAAGTAARDVPVQGTAADYRVVSGLPGLVFCAIDAADRLHCARTDVAPVQVRADRQWRDVTFDEQLRRVCALDREGAVWCARGESFGWTPGLEGVQFERRTGLPALVSMASGSSSWCGIAADDGSIWCWGQRFWLTAPTGPEHPLDSDVTRFVLEQPTRSIDLADRAACAVDVSGTAWCWGKGYYASLGGAAIADTASAPRRVNGSIGLESVTMSFSSPTCGRTAIGAPQCWGFDAGLLGDGGFFATLRPSARTAPNLLGVRAMTTTGLGGHVAIRSGRPGLTLWGEATPYHPPSLLGGPVERLTQWTFDTIVTPSANDVTCFRGSRAPGIVCTDLSRYYDASFTEPATFRGMR
jgi:hypothetical protein